MTVKGAREGMLVGLDLGLDLSPGPHMHNSFLHVRKITQFNNGKYFMKTLKIKINKSTYV